MKSVLALLTVLMISACGSTPEPVNKPAELSPIENPIKVKVVWDQSSGVGSQGQYVRLQPAISADRIWTIDIAGSLVAHDRVSGRQLWKRETGLAVSGALGLGDGRLLVGTRDAKLVALSAETGEQLWVFNASSEILSVPAISLDIAVAQTGDGHVFAVSAKEGKEGKQIWDYSRSLPLLTLRGTANPVVRESRVYAGFADGKAVSLGLLDGRVFWEKTISIPGGRTEIERLVDVDASPLSVGDEIYVVSYQGNITSLFGATGDKIWNRQMSAHSGLAVETNRIFLADSKDHLWSLGRSNGASLWKQDKLQGRRLSAATLYGDYLVAGDFEGYLHFLRRSDGKISARIQVGNGGFASAPVTVEDKLYIYTGDGKLVALEFEDEQS